MTSSEAPEVPGYLRGIQYAIRQASRLILTPSGERAQTGLELAEHLRQHYDEYNHPSRGWVYGEPGAAFDQEIAELFQLPFCFSWSTNLPSAMRLVEFLQTRHALSFGLWTVCSISSVTHGFTAAFAYSVFPPEFHAHESSVCAGWAETPELAITRAAHHAATCLPVWRST